MNQQTELWRQIEQFAIDADGATLTFADRLARENGWSRGFARRVVGEYKRFVFMAMIAEHEVTPSDEVDEAWHLHLTYTRSYWDKLCRGVLGKPLHHSPTRGGPAERARHIDQYNQTLATYRELFGQAPPSDIWPPADVRFAKSSCHVRVNRGRTWIVPKLRLPRQLVGGGSLLAGALATPLMVGIVNPLNLTGPEFLMFYGTVCMFAILAAYFLRQFLRNSTSHESDSQLSPYEIACLGGGVPGVLRACLATLIVDKRLQLVPGDKVPSLKASRKARDNDHNIERIMLREANHENGATAGDLLDATRPAAEEIQSSLQGRGLMETNESFAAARWGPMILLSIVLLVGFAKFLVGLNRDKPVAFLFFILLGLALSMVFYFWRMPLRTKRGEGLLTQLKSQYDRLKSVELGAQTDVASSPMASSDMLLAAGLFGLAALHHPDVTTLDQSLKPLSQSRLASSSGCGASTGCGGGGGGGGDGGGCGGGGCGGCGGN